jgi:hypothetical protein
MVEESRIAIYDYLKPLFSSVTQNIYPMRVPTENTSDDTTNGFIVIEIGNIVDESEFDLHAYAEVRCFVTAYVPQKTRGRLDKTKYETFENGINAAIRAEINHPSSNVYYIQSDGILSMDDDEDTNKGNQYNVFVKSFIVTIDGSEEVSDESPDNSENTENNSNND